MRGDISRLKGDRDGGVHCLSNNSPHTAQFNKLNVEDFIGKVTINGFYR
jgi:hypothetical protein